MGKMDAEACAVVALLARFGPRPADSTRRVACTRCGEYDLPSLQIDGRLDCAARMHARKMRFQEIPAWGTCIVWPCCKAMGIAAKGCVACDHMPMRCMIATKPPVALMLSDIESSKTTDRPVVAAAMTPQDPETLRSGLTTMIPVYAYDVAECARLSVEG